MRDSFTHVAQQDLHRIEISVLPKGTVPVETCFQDFSESVKSTENAEVIKFTTNYRTESLLETHPQLQLLTEE